METIAKEEDEQEQILAYVEGLSVAGIKISLLKTGETTVFLVNMNGVSYRLKETKIFNEQHR